MRTPLLFVPDEARTPKRIIVWWERRRIVYNLFIVAAFVAGVLALKALDPMELFTEFSNGLVLIPFLVVFNLAYPLCWGFELILYYVAGPSHPETRHYPPWAFASALLLTALFLSILPLAIVAQRASGIIRYPQYRQAATKPDPADLPGWYQLSDFSRAQLTADGALVPDSCGILLRDDGSYRAVNPQFRDSAQPQLLETGIEEPGRWQVRSVWKIWVIALTSDSLIKETSPGDQERLFRERALHLIDNRPPYRLRLDLNCREIPYVFYHKAGLAK